MSLHTIPIVDLSEFLKGGESKQQFVYELGKAFEDVGFVSVRHHGVPQTLIAVSYTHLDVYKRQVNSWCFGLVVFNGVGNQILKKMCIRDSKNSCR